MAQRSHFGFTLSRQAKLRIQKWLETRKESRSYECSHAIEVIAVHRDQICRQAQEISPLMKPNSGTASAEPLQIPLVFTHVLTFVNVSHLNPSNSLPASPTSALNHNSSNLRPLKLHKCRNQSQPPGCLHHHVHAWGYPPQLCTCTLSS